jgi:serine protease Do
MKFDLDKNSEKEFLKGREGFPRLDVSERELDEGEPVYAFGYPLGSGEVHSPAEGIQVGHVGHGPRVTSAIVASRTERTAMVSVLDVPPETYVLDKALNYGNSGGPIVSTETGCVHAVCRRFQPVYIPQQHLADASGNVPHVMVPSLYGAASNLGHPAIRAQLEEAGVPISST